MYLFIFLCRTEVDFEHACNETLESLCEYFEEIIENSPQLDNPDITFSVCISQILFICKILN